MTFHDLTTAEYHADEASLDRTHELEADRADAARRDAIATWAAKAALDLYDIVDPRTVSQEMARYDAKRMPVAMLAALILEGADDVMQSCSYPDADDIDAAINIERAAREAA